MPNVLPLESNLLLGGLPPDSLDRLRPAMRVVELQVSERIYESGAMPDAYFPLDGIVSRVHELAEGTSIEVGMVGAEGMAGISGLVGVPSAHLGLTQGRGLFAACSVRALREVFDSDAQLRTRLLRWMHVELAQTAQVAVCNRLHATELRLAHWLLLIHDRASAEEISVTQEFLGLMLGSRRATISEAMGALVRSGSIAHSRARVRVLDRPLLERQACECYAASVAHYETAFGFAPRAKARATPVD